MPTKEVEKEIKKPPVLFNKTQETIRSLKESLDGDFIAYWISGKSRISDSDVVALYNLLELKVSSKRLYLFIKSGGGNGQSSLRIINLLRHHYEEIVALVPLDCASAATMLALGANKIFMGPLAYLSAIDTSIVHDLSPVDKDHDRVSVSQVELSRVLKMWEEKKEVNDSNPYSALYGHIHPLVFGAVDRASSLSIKLTTEILSYHMDDSEKVSKISQHLNSTYPSHGYPITLREAEKIGLNVAPLTANINNQLLILNQLYSEMAQLAFTDYDELNYHDNEILKVIEASNLQIFYQKDKDMHYRKEEHSWVPMNDNSSWRRVVQDDKGDLEETKFYIN
jgi:hypothetical protein